MGSTNNSGVNPQQMKTRKNGKGKDVVPDTIRLSRRRRNPKSTTVPVPAPVDTRSKTFFAPAPPPPPRAPAPPLAPQETSNPSAALTLEPSESTAREFEIEVIEIDDDNEDEDDNHNQCGLVRIAPLESLTEPEEKMEMELGVTAPVLAAEAVNGSGLILLNDPQNTHGPVRNTSLPPPTVTVAPVQTTPFNENRNFITHAQSNAGVVNNVQVCTTNPIDKVVSSASGTMQTVYNVNSHSRLQSNYTHTGGNAPLNNVGNGYSSSSSQSSQFKIKVNSETGNLKIVKVVSVGTPNSSGKASSASTSAVSVPVQTSPTSSTSSSSTNFISVARNSNQSPRFNSNANTNTRRHYHTTKVSLHHLNPNDYPNNPEMQKRIKRSIANNTSRERKMMVQELVEQNRQLQGTVHALATRLLDIQRSVNAPLLALVDPKIVLGRGGRNGM